MNGQVLLRLLAVAVDLHEGCDPGDVDSEYTRGQADLIRNVCGLLDEDVETLIRLIGGAA